MRKPRKRKGAVCRKDDRVTSAASLSCYYAELVNQGDVYEKSFKKWGVPNSLFLLGFSYYKSAVRNKCFTCGLILCRPKHLGSTRRARDCLDSLNAAEFSLVVTCEKGKNTYILFLSLPIGS